jgi:Protein of unknown function (DUF1559)
MKRVLIGCGIGLMVLFLLVDLIPSVAFDIALELVAGWRFFLARVLPEVAVNIPALVSGVLCLVLVGAGLHLFLRWVRASRIPCTSEAAQRRPWTLRKTMAVLGVVGLMFVVGLAFVGLYYQAAWLLTAKEPWSEEIRKAQTQSQNNLHQMTIAAHEYLSTEGTFPPGATADPHGTLMHGWQSFLLPYLEGDSLYKQVDFSVPWDHPNNAAVFRTEFKPYQHQWAEERHDAAGYALSHYAANVHLLGGTRRVTFEEIQAGPGVSKIVLFGEVGSHFKPWGQPANWRDPSLEFNSSPNSFGSPSAASASRYPRLVQFAMADGSVRIFSITSDEEERTLRNQRLSRK